MRQQCSGMMLQFVLDYPLGARRLQHHLQFLITNLSFEHESGRQAAVDTIKVHLTCLPTTCLTDAWWPGSACTPVCWGCGRWLQP